MTNLNTYYYRKGDGEGVGPFSQPEIEALLIEGTIEPQTPVMRHWEGFWRTYDECHELECPRSGDGAWKIYAALFAVCLLVGAGMVWSNVKTPPPAPLATPAPAKPPSDVAEVTEPHEAVWRQGYEDGMSEGARKASQLPAEPTPDEFKAIARGHFLASGLPDAQNEFWLRGFIAGYEQGFTNFAVRGSQDKKPPEP